MAADAMGMSDGVLMERRKKRTAGLAQPWARMSVDNDALDLVY
jgi:hypothetical protein